MSAREDYPLLAWMEGSAPWPEGPKPTLAESVSGALSHIDALRHVAEAAIVWRRCKYAMHGNTANATKRHHLAVQWAERRLAERVLDLVGETPTLTGDCDGCPKPTDGCPGDCPTRWRSHQ